MDDTAAAAVAAATPFLQARWGTVAHLTFLVFCLLTNIIVTSMLILGGAAVVNGLTGGRCFLVKHDRNVFDQVN
jgi:Na+/proline symporter